MILRLTGITGGEEDGVDNTGVKADELYTKPEQVIVLNTFQYLKLFNLFWFPKACILRDLCACAHVLPCYTAESFADMS